MTSIAIIAVLSLAFLIAAYEWRNYRRCFILIHQHGWHHLVDHRMGWFVTMVPPDRPNHGVQSMLLHHAWKEQRRRDKGEPALTERYQDYSIDYGQIGVAEEQEMYGWR